MLTVMQAPVSVRSTAARLGVELSENQWALLERYVDLLMQANREINLISRKDEGNVWSGHILHALSLLGVVNLPSGLRVLDLGTGGGLPGIPLAVARQDLTVTLVDSIQKKVRAVGKIVNQLGLTNVRCEAGRAEEMKVPEGARYHIVVARAVAPLVDLLRWSKGLLARTDRAIVGVRLPEGVREMSTPLLLAMKGGDLEEELRRAGIRFPGIAPVVTRIAHLERPMSALDDKKVIVVPR
jgi:16S rRNA (guanine527-N7)-methyltransferase